MRIPKYGRPQKDGVPMRYISANVPSGMIGQYSTVSQKFIVDTYLDRLMFEEKCKEISTTHSNCIIKIIQ